MSQTPSVAASLTPASRHRLAVEMPCKTDSVSHIADNHTVSRKFLYQQKQKATEAFEKCICASQPKVGGLILPTSNAFPALSVDPESNSYLPLFIIRSKDLL